MLLTKKLVEDMQSSEFSFETLSKRELPVLMMHTVMLALNRKDTRQFKTGLER